MAAVEGAHWTVMCTARPKSTSYRNILWVFRPAPTIPLLPSPSCGTPRNPRKIARFLFLLDNSSVEVKMHKEILMWDNVRAVKQGRLALAEVVTI